MNHVTAFDLVFGDPVTTLLRLADEHTASSSSSDKKLFVDKDTVPCLIKAGADFKMPREQEGMPYVMELTLKGRTFICCSFSQIEVPLHLVPSN